MDKEQNKISCQIFNKEEPVINRITEEINNAHGVQEEAWWAEELIKDVKILLECPQHDGAKLDCMNCRTICKLRYRTTNLMLKVRKLA